MFISIYIEQTITEQNGIVNNLIHIILLTYVLIPVLAIAFALQRTSKQTLTLGLELSTRP